MVRRCYTSSYLNARSTILFSNLCRRWFRGLQLRRSPLHNCRRFLGRGHLDRQPEPSGGDASVGAAGNRGRAPRHRPVQRHHRVFSRLYENIRSVPMCRLFRVLICESTPL